ncbi:PucR family transcriptional regulator [Mycobacterium sp. Root265]|uniref:PucR family transcriptional regulator n=1 Tax=Mycobacterium sp. Root265 TaxID=1736504 RepID=UPI00070CE42F|nr:PucR family transcriptional regulator [Mycobacterium sp. Root265]KRD12035.1 PucR family transcriptional regulator [Mycobacterium sp. Root265]
MQLTVAEVIALPVIQAGDPEVLSAHRFGETIRWVHVSDVPDLSALVQGGELVLTTGAALRDSPRRYLSGMAAAGVLGVVVEIGETDLDAGMGAIAAEFDLALVSLHRQVRFVEVTEAVHRLIVADQYERVDFDRRVHETFTELSLKRPSAAGVVEAAAAILDEPVVLEDLTHRALAVSLRGRPADLLRDWERRSRLRATAEEWAVTAVGPRAEQWGRLIVPQPSPDPDRTRMVLERAAVALALQRMIERDRTGLHHQAQSGLIDDVLRGRITDEREAAARAHALGLRSAARYTPVAVRVGRAAAATDPVVAQRRNALLVDTVLHTVNASGHAGLCALRRDGEVGAVLALGVTRPEDDALAALGTALRIEIARVDGTAGAVLAVGPAVEGVIDAVTGLGEAAHIAEVALAMRGEPRPFYRAADVRLHGLISLLRDDPRVQTFAETELRALLAGDPAHLDLLREYLKLAGNKAAVAARLHISRPALYKRLAAVRSALGVDLDDGESMTSLHVALMVLDAQGRGVLS